MTDLSICNAALTKVGAESILSLDDDTKTASTCKERFPDCKQIILRKHPWNCAVTRVTLAPILATPPYGYSYQFVLPTDCIRILEVSDEDYVVEGRSILCDSDTIELRYVANVATHLLDALVAEAISCYLAWDICYKITQSSTLKEQLYKEYKDALKAAKTPDSQEEAVQELTADYYLESRFSGSSATPKRIWP